jgi:uncharacterized membrane protein
MVEPSVDALPFVGLLAVHVLAGVVALGAGIGAITTTKGGRRHNAAGRLYVRSMAVVVTTAALLAVWVADWFLLAIAVFTGYLVLNGYRIVARRRTGQTGPTGLDYAVHGTMLAVGGGMLLAGGWQTATGPPGRWPALAAFGGIGSVLALSEVTRLRRPPEERTTWVVGHIGFMGGAYIATVTAAVTVNLTMLPPLARWLGPTVLGVPAIGYAVRRHGPRFGGAA